MNILLLALNAKYIHSSLALRSIKCYCNDYYESIKILETTINNQENEIIKEIYKASPDILGISCYIWNMSFVRQLIPTLKKILPKMTIILGGPEVSYQSEELFEKLNIDIVMEGEGEVTWKEYLDYRINNQKKLSNIKGLVYKEQDKIIRNMPREPLNLQYLPFVYDYLAGLEHKIIYYEASRGCPFNCQYCLSSIEKGVRFVPIDTVKKHLKCFCEQRIKQVKFVDRTFNAQKTYAMEIWKYLIENDNQYTNFHFEIAAELLDNECLDLLSQARPGLFQFEIGVQTTNKEVLKVIKRQMPYENLREIILKIKALGNIHQHLDLIAGLPLETYESFKASFNDVISLWPEQFQLGFLKVLKGSGLRRDAELYGLIYKEEPPYEILYTNSIGYHQLLLLHSVEEMLERYYNTGRFKNILEYLLISFKSPFNFFEELALYWEEKEYDKIQHNKLSYYLKLAEFCMTKDWLDHELCKELIRFDYLKHDMLRDVPKELQTLNQEIFKQEDHELLKNDEYLKKAVPDLVNFSPRERFKNTQIEHFKYNVYYNQDYNKSRALLCPCRILFVYLSNKVSCILLDEELPMNETI